MNEKVNQLRKLALKLDVSGTATPISNTKLYQGGFGFVMLQAYVPITQNRSPDTLPLCTTHRVITDSAGNRKQFNNDKYNLLYIDNVTLSDGNYMLFECPLPKVFTDTVGELEIVINYAEVKDVDGVLTIVSRLASNVYRTRVDEGGISDGETIDPTAGELARLNELTIKVEGMEDCVNALVSPPDLSEANQTGEVKVEIDEAGRLKFSNLKGEPGKTILPLKKENVTVSNWIADSTYPSYSYKASITVTGVSIKDYAEVIFSQAEATSGNYAQVAIVSTDTVTIYSKVNQTIIIPLIWVQKGE